MIRLQNYRCTRSVAARHHVIMLPACVLSTALCSALLASTAAALAPPDTLRHATPSPRDLFYPGVIGIVVDTTDTDHRVMKVHESIPVTPGAVSTLLFPQWSFGDHAPNGPVDRLAGLRVIGGGQALSWKRDPYDVYTFHIALPPGVRTLEVSYDILGSLQPDQGTMLTSATMLDLQWPTVLLYPAGYAITGINYRAAVQLPPDWKFASALAAARQGDLVSFGQAPLDVLADSPVMAAKYINTVSLAEGANPVRLDLAADKPDALEPPPGFVSGYRRLVAEAGALFGAPPYNHYDMLLWLSGDFGPVYYEHRQSEEINMPVSSLRSWDVRPDLRSVFAHDYVHA